MSIYMSEKSFFLKHNKITFFINSICVWHKLNTFTRWTMNLRLWSKPFKGLHYKKQKLNYGPAISTSSAFLVTQMSKEQKKTSCLWKPHHDTQLSWAPMAASAEADRRLMTPDEGSLQTASWISHHLLLTWALIRSQPASAASWGPQRLCKLKDSRLNGKEAEWADFLQNCDWWWQSAVNLRVVLLYKYVWFSGTKQHTADLVVAGLASEYRTELNVKTV